MASRYDGPGRPAAIIRDLELARHGLTVVERKLIGRFQHPTEFLDTRRWPRTRL